MTTIRIPISRPTGKPSLIDTFADPDALVNLQNALRQAAFKADPNAALWLDSAWLTSATRDVLNIYDRDCSRSCLNVYRMSLNGFIDLELIDNRVPNWPTCRFRNPDCALSTTEDIR